MKRLLAVAVLLICFASCKEELGYTRPEYDPDAFETAFEPQSSHIPFPLFVSYTELENLINRAMPIVLLNETNFDKGKLKNAKARLLRTGPVQLSKRENRLFLRVPIKADVRPRVTKNVLGIDMKVAPKIKAAFYLNLSTSVDFNSTYQIISDLKVESVDWIDDPTVRVVFWDLPITEVVDGLIQDKSKKIETALNKVVADGVNIRKPIGKIWTDIQKPLRINRKVEEVYLLNRPYGLKLGEIELTDVGVVANLELLSYVKTGLRGDTIRPIPTALPKLTKVDSTNRQFEINFLVQVPLNAASAALEEQFAKRSIGVSGTSLRIERIYVHTSPEHLILSTQLSEPTSTILRFESLVHFNAADTSIAATDFDFMVVHGNSLVKAAEAALHTTVLEAIGDKLRIPLGGLIGDIGPLVEGAIEKGQIGKSISLGLSDVMLEPTEIVLRPDTVLLNVRGAGQVTLQILDFKPKRETTTAQK